MEIYRLFDIRFIYNLIPFRFPPHGFPLVAHDINNIDTYETRTKIDTKKWSPIYEVIDESYIEESKNFPDDFIRDCKNNSNKAQFISADVKNNIKRMVTERSLYSQVIIVRRKDLIFFVTDKKKNEAKFKFQRISARSKLWFDLDLDWIEINFITFEPDFYKEFFKDTKIRKTIIN